jgi:hypothetical protein
MRNDVRKVKPIFVDLETKSSCPIEYGATRYFADKDADWLICSVVDTLGEATTATNYTGGKEISPKIQKHKGLFVAHNWFFEWSFFNQFYPGTRAADWRNWMCTAAMARWFGICAPRAKLEDVAVAFGLEKMPEGKSLIARYSVPQKQRSTMLKGVPDYFIDPRYGDGFVNNFFICEKGSDDALLFEKYCAKDADLSRIIYQKFDAHGGFNAEEFRAAQAIDVRGVPVDVKAAQFLVNRKDKDKKNAFQMAERIAGRTSGGALVLSASGAFIEFMKKTFAIDLPDARAGTLDAIDFSTHPGAEAIEHILYVRKLLTARAGDKAQLMLDRAYNGRVTSATVFHAAGTGRFQSWGVNFFNFSRQSVKNWEKEKNSAPVPALQRGVVCAPKGKTITESDWRGIENYLSLYYAGDTEQLHRIEAGESPYLIFAEKLYGEKITKEDKRYVPAKSAVLGCGYGAGYTKLSIIYRLDLDVAKQLHAGWRKVNPKIVAMWYAFHDAMVRAAVYREIARERGFTFSPLGNDNDVKITLQDGHDLYYRGLDVHYDEKNRVQIMRDGQALHGGLITENLMQATCARLLYRALVRCEKEGLEVILHIYDSIMIESKIKNAKCDALLLENIMCDAPPWASDLKLRVDQHTGKRWTK